jgi:hypothetical protein
MADKTPTREIVYGGEAISREISEPKLRKVYYRLEQGHVEGALKAGSTWALNVPVYRRSVRLDPK